MADVRSSPMLPLRWADAPAGRAGPHPDPAADPSERAGLDASAEPEVDTGRAANSGSCTDQPPQVRPTEQLKPDVVVRTSSRRRKTAAAFWENGRIVVVMPSHVPRADRPELVEWLVARVMTKRPGAAAGDDELAARAATLADRYVDGVRAASIRWVTNQGKRWGSCTTQTGEIRLSHRLRAVPEWVLDATIVHELAHLLHADHSDAFHAVADRYPRQRDALVFLEGYSLGLQTAGGTAP